MQYIIWGAGQQGDIALEWLGFLRVTFFIDENKSGKVFKEKPVLSYEKGIEKYMEDFHTIIVIASTNYSGEMEGRLIRDGIRRYFVFDGRDPAYAINAMPFYVLFKKRINLSYTQIISKYFKRHYKNISIYGDNGFTHYLVAELMEQFPDAAIQFIEPINENEQKCKYEMGLPTLCLDEIIKISDCIVINCNKSSCNIRNILEEQHWDRKKLIDIYGSERIEPLFENRNIEKYKNVHKGKRIFVIGNGPSLKLEDLEILRKNSEICIAFNNIFKVFDRILWRPDYICVSDWTVIATVKNKLDDLEIPVIMADHFHRNIQCLYSRNVEYIHLEENDYGEYLPEFSDDLTEKSINGNTVTYDLGLQFAAYMGADEIVLIGVDNKIDGAFYNNNNHFIKDYFSNEEKEMFKNIIPDMRRSDKAYEAAEKYSRQHGFRIYNATRGGALEVFERVDFDSLFLRNNNSILRSTG